MHSTTDLKLELLDPTDATAAALLRELTDELARRYKEDGSGAFKPADVSVPRSAFVVARLNGFPVGCGALRPHEANVAEIKRMYVRLEHRNRGIARKILAELERLAAGFGYREVILETGKRQPEAIHLYEKIGYERIRNFGIYVGRDLSVCFRKSIAALNR